MMYFDRLIVQECYGVVSVPQTYLTEVFISLSYLYAFVCPSLCLAELVAFSITALLSALSVWAFMPPFYYSALGTSDIITHNIPASLSVFLLVLSAFSCLACCIPLRTFCSTDTVCKCHISYIIQPVAFPPPTPKGQPPQRLPFFDGIIIAP